MYPHLTLTIASLAALLLTACITTPGVAKLTGEALTEEQEAECTQRAQGSVEAIEAMNRGTRMGDYEGWDDQRRGWVAKNNPCLDTAGPSSLDKDEQEQRAFARTRARILLDSNQPQQARDALVIAFHTPAPTDPEIYSLAREATAQLAEQDARLEPGMCKITPPAATTKPVALWTGGGLAQLRCLLPDAKRDPSSTLRLVVRQRINNTRRQVIWTYTPTDEELERDPTTLSAPIPMPILGPEQKPPGARAHYTLSAELLSKGQPAITLARGELLWFDQP